MRGLSVVMAVVGMLLSAACGPGFDEKTGGDGSRGDAVEIKVDKLYDDRLSADAADNSDWKKFELDEDSKVTLAIWWDNPRVKSSVTVRDELGRKLHSIKHKKGERQEALGPFTLKEGTFYVEIKMTSGSSVYTFGLSTETADGGGALEPDF